ncbi:HEAT repeat domain-containing protein [Rhodothermus profundi]|uniref:HEAT repeat-containing protein n=1 Tax=Rhodothermus profundi TaxID=633813 RepID=A0A1M6USY1_9BACT|nr:HEAT repeat domain-containing protein [Rhodothermus profundi]SHK72309.1 HEAT repeat-containing protein [Rhodothermus profundi]
MKWFDPTRFFSLSYDALLFRLVIDLLIVLSGLASGLVVLAILLRIRNDRLQQTRKQLEAMWRPLLMKVLMGECPPAELQQRIAPAHRFFFLEFVYRYARRVQGQDFQTLCLLARPFLPYIRDELKKAAPEERARRLQILGLLGFEDYQEDLIAALDDPSPLVAIVAFRQLARGDRPEFAPLLVAKLDRVRHFSHEMLASLLASMGGCVLPPLREILRDPSQPAWRRAIAANVLARLNDATAGPLAAQALQTPELPGALLVALLRLLGTVGTPEMLPVLRVYLTHPEEEVRAEAVRALGQIGGSQAVPLLVKALDDPSPWVAFFAAAGLRRAGQNTLLRQIANSKHPRHDLVRQVLAEERLPSDTVSP